MLICNTCGQLTEELPTYIEHHPYGEGTAPEEMTDWDCECGGEFEEANICKRCGEYFGNSFEGDFCPDCATEINERFVDFMCKFTVEERAFLNDYYEGREI